MQWKKEHNKFEKEWKNFREVNKKNNEENLWKV